MQRRGINHCPRARWRWLLGIRAWRKTTAGLDRKPQHPGHEQATDHSSTPEQKDDMNDSFTQASIQELQEPIE